MSRRIVGVYSYLLYISFYQLYWNLRIQSTHEAFVASIDEYPSDRLTLMSKTLDSSAAEKMAEMYVS